MNTKPLEKFAQAARRQLHEQVRARLEQVMGTDSPELRARQKAINELNKQIAQSSRQAVVEQVAYTWFNRFCALRYMDANRYTRLGVISPAAGFTQPEILQEAKAGHIDPDLAPFVDSQRIHDLLSGHTPSPNPQQEAYRLLLVGSCNQYHQAMPFLFEKIDDYSELLMPDDLLSASSILQQMREALTDDACQDVEVIGWLYQFYISEKKAEVDAKVNKGGKVTTDELPAKTTLYTKHWIVRYLVENSLGRLWVLNHPNSKLVENMAYYVSSEQPERDFLPVSAPEELTICDPAVGSGHMLTYAFDLLYDIYEEEGYNPADIPRLILEKNLFGLEIDERAAALAAFALTMKARAKDRRFFRRGVAPHIVTLCPIAFTEAELEAEVDALLPLLAGSWQEKPRQMSLLAENQKQLSLSDAGGLQGLREDLRHDLALFRQADNVGSLLRPRLNAAQLIQLHDRLSAPAGTGQLSLFNEERRKKARQAIAQAIPLARHYHAVIANPPYLGRSMNEQLGKFAKEFYPDSKSDLFAMFVERGLEMALFKGYNAMVTMESWMFLSSYESLRTKLLNKATISCMVHMPYLGKGGTPIGINFGTAATVFKNHWQEDFKGHFSYVRYYETDEDYVPHEFPVQNERLSRAAATDFKKIPGSPIAYWLNESIKTLYEHPLIGAGYEAKEGVGTRNDEVFMRMFWEVSQKNISREERWILTDKAGDFRRWYMGFSYLMDWENDGYRIKNYRNEDGSLRSRPQNTQYLFEEGVSWGKVGSGIASFRWRPKGFGFNDAAPTLFGPQVVSLLAPLNSIVTRYLLTIRGSTLNITTGVVKELPNLITSKVSEEMTNVISDRAILLARHDWDSYETSWDFTTLPLLAARQPNGSSAAASLAATYAALRQGWQAATLEMQRLEEENNRLFIHAYGLQDELTPQVPLSEITLTCNPHYRYGSGQLSVDSSQLAFFTTNYQLLTNNWPEGTEGHEIRLLADTLREFISYAVGCMFGRYSLDAPGLILANQGETVEDYVHKQASLSVIPANAGIHKGMDSRIRGNDTVEGLDSRPTPSRGQAIRGNDTVEGAGERRSGGDTPPLHTSQFTIHNSKFPPDRDNAIPMLDGDWFSDDITERFKKFLRLTFGEAHYEENLAFIEAALGRDIRGYFLREFYNDHVRMYKKRPIYWLFSSAKGGFNVLIYMHRYRPDTVSVILNDYLREYRAKLTARKSHLEGVSVSASATPRDKTQALKEVAAIQKTLQELRDYEDDILYPLATHQLQIDLDDGVLVNYNKFGKALKKVTGLSDA